MTFLKLVLAVYLAGLIALAIDTVRVELLGRKPWWT